MEDIEIQDLRKREKCLRRCKNMLLRRLRSEYLNALRERHNTIHKVKELEVKPGGVVMIKGEEKNRGMWKIGAVASLITCRDVVTPVVKLRAGKSYSERAIQHLDPIELQCQERPRKNPELNAQARESRPKRQWLGSNLRTLLVKHDVTVDHTMLSGVAKLSNLRCSAMCDNVR